MAFGYTGDAISGGNSAAPSITHGQTINAGDLVGVYVNSNSTTALSADAGGNVFNEAFDEIPSGETARHAFFWKIAGASEPSSYSFTSGSSQWQVLAKVFTSATDAVIDLAAATDKNAGNSSNMLCGAPIGRIIAPNALSFVGGGKDTRNANAYAFDSADESYVSSIGTTEDEATCLAHRFYTAGDTGAIVTITPTTAAASDSTYSFHMSFVESSVGSGIVPRIMHHRGQMQ